MVDTVGSSCIGIIGLSSEARGTQNLLQHSITRHRSFIWGGGVNKFIERTDRIVLFSN